MSGKKRGETPYFNENNLLEHLKVFNFPRLSGTEGEKKAVDLVVKRFRDIGFTENQIQKHPFEFSDFYSTTLIKLIGIISMTFILILVFFSYIYLIFKIIMIGVMALIVLLIIRGLKHPEFPGFWGKYYGKMRSSTNIFVKIPAKELPFEEAGNIVVSAHIDTKSQSLRTIWRIRVYIVWLFSGIVLGGFYIAKTVYLEIAFFFDLPQDIFEYIEFNIRGLDLIMIILTIFILIANTFLLFLNTHNKSPGGLDNGSGLAIVFEMSRFFKNRPLSNFNLWFCQFSAEELGTMGSRFFVNTYEKQFERDKIFQFNFDMVSALGMKRNQLEYMKSFGIFPKRHVAPVLSKYLQRAAKQENINIYGFHLPTGAHTDSVPFHLRKYDAVDFITRDSGKFTHSIEDTLDKVDPKILRDACIVAKRAILMIDNYFKSLIET